MLVGVTVAVALAGREIGVRHGLHWLSAHWTRLALLFAAIAALFAPAAAFVMDAGELASRLLCVGAFMLAIIGAGGVYWRARPGFAALVIVIGFADAFFICLGYRVIEDAIGFDFDDAVPALTGFAAMIA